MADRYWDLDGGPGDRHRILLDEKGEWWGWENVNPRDKYRLTEALLRGATRWNHYTVTALEASAVT